MTKAVNDKGQIWFERSNDVVTIGFTRSFLDSLDQCWHILPANLTRFREKAPLMVVETNDTLISIMSPVSAHYTSWSDKAQNFPYKLTEEDVVLELNMVAARTTPGRARTVQVNMPGLDMAAAQRVVFNNTVGPVQAVNPMNWDILADQRPVGGARDRGIDDGLNTTQRQLLREIEARQARMNGAVPPPPAPLRRNRPQDEF